MSLVAKKLFLDEAFSSTKHFPTGIGLSRNGLRTHQHGWQNMFEHVYGRVWIALFHVGKAEPTFSRSTKLDGAAFREMSTAIRFVTDHFMFGTERGNGGLFGGL